MRKLGLAFAVIALIVLLFMLQFILGTLAIILKIGVAILLAYAAYELWTGWKQAG